VPSPSEGMYHSVFTRNRMPHASKHSTLGDTCPAEILPLARMLASERNSCGQFSILIITSIPPLAAASVKSESKFAILTPMSQSPDSSLCVISNDQG
jgi:preprotein translocase subunit SecB